ncbi:MAG: MFS transporter [Ramlibacter sp.]|nr:MFS transporter [Ramlibacter sp.]
MRSFLPLVVTLLIQAFSALALMAVPVLVPVEPGTPRLTTAGIGAFVLVAYCGAVIGSLSAGSLVDRWGAIRSSQVALLLSAAGLALAALVPAVLPLAGLLIGLAYGPITPASSHVLIRTTPEHQRNLVFSIKQTGVPLGVALSGFCIPPLAAATNWHWTLLTLALGCVAVAASATPIRAQLDAHAIAPPHPAPTLQLSLRTFLMQLLEPLAVIFRYRPLRVLAAVSFVLSGIQISLTSYLVSYLTSEMAMTALLAGSILGLSQMGGVMGRIVWGWLSDRLVRPLVMLATLALVVSAASFTAGGLSFWHLVPPTFALASLMFVFGATASGWNGVYLAEVARQAPPGEAGKATSGTLACTFLGVIMGAPLFGLIASHGGGFSGAFALQGLLTLGVAVLLFVFGMPRRGSPGNGPNA